MKLYKVIENKGGVTAPILKQNNMEKIIKLLCTDQEANALLELISKERLIKMVKNDPDWAYTGSGQFYVMYIDNKDGFYCNSIMFQLGINLAKKIVNK